MPTVEERIAKLQKRLRQEKALSQKIRARARYVKQKQERKEETRRKILDGAMLQNRIEKGRLTLEEVNGWRDLYLTRDDDRALFGLPLHGAD